MPHTPREGDDNTKLRERIATTLIGGPEALFEETAEAMAWMVWERAEAWGTEREEDFGRLWTRAWEGAERGKPVKMTGIENPITNAVNQPAGKLAEAALARLPKYEPKEGEKLPERVKPYFDRMSDSDQGQSARVILAAKMHYLHAIDAEWVKERLVPYMRPGESKESAKLWQAFGWSRRMGPNLLHTVKEEFLKALRNAEVSAQAREDLTIIFMTVCLEAPEELEEHEVKDAVNSMTEETLVTVLSNVRARLEGEGKERKRIWKKKAEPWLQKYWPESGERNTSRTSKAMLDMLSESGEGFPQATKWGLQHLRPVTRGLDRLQRSGHAQSHPNETWKLLQKVIDPSVTADYEQTTTREILEALAATEPGLRSNPEYKRLHEWTSR